jgi:FKBP-type peptidyl-prolyl cis-trans isomerase FkpA
MKKIIFIFLLAISISCSSDDENFDEQNEIEIEAYIKENNLNVQKTNSGLYYIIKSTGSGNAPTVNSNVTIGYKGYFLNGNVFDQSSNATFNLSGVIPGFSQGVQLLRPGGSGTFILPSRLGYGTRGSGNIKGGDVIVFDINLISVN